MDSEFQSLAGFRIPRAGFRIPKPGFRIPKPKNSWIPESGFPYMGRNLSEMRPTSPLDSDTSRFNIFHVRFSSLQLYSRPKRIAQQICHSNHRFFTYLKNGDQSFRTHESFVSRRFVPTFDQFVPIPLDDSYPTSYDTKCLKQTNIYFIYPSNRKTIKISHRRQVYV